MRHITSRNLNCRSDAVALGNFDGLHLGHQELIRAAKSCGNATVFSFFPPPSSVIEGIAVKSIMTSDEKACLLKKMGVETFIEYPFDKGLSDMPPESFVRDILVGRLQCRTVIIGEDYRFGRRGRGDCELLRILGEKLGFGVKVIPHVKDKEGKISSTRVREAISKKDFEAAEKLMGRPFFVTGEVVRGKKIGRSMGFPTANILPPEYKFLPQAGVFQTEIIIDKTKFVGMTNVGTRPTVTDDTKTTVETHILDFDCDIYGKTITTLFRQWIRPESKFQSLDELRVQIVRDIDSVRTNRLQTQYSEMPDCFS